MNRHFTVVPTILVALVAACDPAVTLEVRRSLQPIPSPDCFAAGLASSPDVESFRPLGREFREGEDGMEGHWIVVRDPAVRRGVDATLSRAAPPGRSPFVTVTFRWKGAIGRMPAAVEQSAIAIAARILAQVQSACAPRAPGELECIRDGRRIACQSGG